MRRRDQRRRLVTQGGWGPVEQAAVPALQAEIVARLPGVGDIDVAPGLIQPGHRGKFNRQVMAAGGESHRQNIGRAREHLPLADIGLTGGF